jgi:hypothetical protein
LHQAKGKNMPVEQVGKYEISYEAEALPESAGWAAYVAVFGASDNPAHRNVLVERKRVAVEHHFSVEQEALTAAHEAALQLLE